VSKSQTVFYVQRTMAGLLAIDWGSYAENSKGTGYDSAHSVPTAGPENTALDPSYRAFDRTIAAGTQDPSLPSIDTIQNIHYWQQFYILSQTIGGGMTLAHTISGQENRLDYGVHTGLYSVGDEQGRNYVCGLFPGAGANEWGFVKWDPRNDAWSDGIITVSSLDDLPLTKHTGSRMSPCVTYQGRLYHATGGVVTIYDPSDDTIMQTAYTDGSLIDRLVIASGRLWLVTAGSGAIHVKEVAYGVVFLWASLGGHSISIVGGGDFGLLRFGALGEPDHDRFYIVFFKSDGGGTGSVMFRIQTSTPSPTTTNTSVMVPLAPSGLPPFSTSEMRYPGGIDQAVWSWESAIDNVDRDPVSPGPHSLTKVMKLPLFEDSGVGPPPYPTINTFGLRFNGESSRMSEQGVPQQFGEWVTSHRYSSSSCFLGGDDRRRNTNRPKWWLISATEYSDAGVTRGLLLKFWGQHKAPGIGGQSVRFVYGRNHQRPNQYATLDGGTPSLAYGGTASFNAGLNRVDQCDPEAVSAGFTTILHGAVTAGPFEVGASVLGSVSGSTAVVQVATSGALFLGSVSGPFTPTETITQTNFPNAGANATVTEQQDAVEHQIVWDLDADGVQAGEWVCIAPFAFRTDAYPIANPPPNDEDALFSGYALAVLIGFSARETTTPTTTGSGVVEVGTDTAATPQTTTSGAVEEGASTSATPQTTTSGVVEILPQTSATTLSTASGVVEVVSSTSSTPVTAGSGIAELVTGTSSTPVTTGSGIAELVTGNSQTPITTGGGVVEILTSTDLVPQSVGGVGSEPIDGPGSVAFQQDGIEMSARDVVNFTSLQLGQPLVADISVVPDVHLDLSGIVELGRASIDAVGDAATTTYALLNMTAASLVAAGITDVRVVAVSVSGVGAQPTLSLGLTGAFADHVPTTALTLTASENHQSLPLAQPRPNLAPGDVLSVQLDGVATATTYMIDVVVYGFAA